MGTWKQSPKSWLQHNVYFKSSGAGSSRAYLYYNSQNKLHQWIISNTIGQSNGYAYVTDAAAQTPDAISQVWSVSTGSAWRQEPELTVQCAGDPTPAPTTFLSHPDSKIKVKWQSSAFKPRPEDKFLVPSTEETQGRWVTWACIIIGGLVVMVLSVSFARYVVLSEAHSTFGVEMSEF
jgi:hypothetical protein